jgi:hypothetical protein
MDEDWVGIEWEFHAFSGIKGTMYTPAEMVECMGRVWALERNMFRYCLCPQQRFSLANMNEYRREWDYRMEESARLRQSLRQEAQRRPKQRSSEIPRDSNESLELAINMIRNENNQMQIRLNRCLNSREVELRGIEHLRQYWTDGDLSDE